MIKFSTLFKTVASNFATALNTANEHNALSNDRNRRIWNWADAARKKAEAHARWLKDQAEAHARRAAAAARRKAEQARAHARRLKAQAEAHARRAAAAARRKAEQARAHAHRVAAEARRKAEQARAHARRVAAEARRKAEQAARAFVNTIQNKFGGFNGVLKAFRIGFFFM